MNAPESETVSLPLADMRALLKLAWEMAHHISETDTSATGSIYGIEYAHRTIAKVSARVPTATSGGTAPDVTSFSPTR